MTKMVMVMVVTMMTKMVTELMKKSCLKEMTKMVTKMMTELVTENMVCLQIEISFKNANVLFVVSQHTCVLVPHIGAV